MVEDSELAKMLENDETLALLEVFQRRVKSTPGSITIDAQEWVEREIMIQKALIQARGLAETTMKLIERNKLLSSVLGSINGTSTSAPASIALPVGYTTGTITRWEKDINA